MVVWWLEFELIQMSGGLAQTLITLTTVSGNLVQKLQNPFEKLDPLDTVVNSPLGTKTECLGSLRLSKCPESLQLSKSLEVSKSPRKVGSPRLDPLEMLDPLASIPSKCWMPSVPRKVGYEKI